MAVGYEIGSEAEFQAYMDATQTVIQLKPGLISEEQVKEIQFAFEYERRDQENAVDVYHNGYQHGLQKAAGKEVAELLNQIDELKLQLSVERALAKYQAATLPTEGEG